MNAFFKTFPFIFCLIFTGCVPTEKTANKTVEKTEISVTVDHSYSEISEYKISWSQIFEISLENYCVYFYSKTCSHCQKLKNYVIETALKTKVIFFVEASDDVILKNLAKSNFYSSFAEIFSISGYPSIAQISNKICVKNVSGEEQVLLILNFLNEVFE